MELDQLRAFIAVLKHGSFLNASTELGMSRSTLRAKIRALETSLDATLLVRTHRGVSSTEFGSTFAVRARTLLHEANALVDLAKTRNEVTGVLRVGVPPGLPPGPGVMFIAELRRRYPNVEIRLDVVVDVAGIDPLDIDLALYFDPKAPVGPFRTFSVLHLPARLLASGSYLAARGRPERVEDLADHALMSWRWPSNDGRSWPLRAGGTVSVAPYFISDDAYLIRTLVAAGQGIAFVPDAETVRATLPGKDVEVVLPQLVGREIAVRVLIPEARAESARSRAVVAVLRDVFRKLESRHLAMTPIPQPDDGSSSE